MFVTIEVRDSETIAQAFRRELVRFDLESAPVQLRGVSSELEAISSAQNTIATEPSMEEILEVTKNVIDHPGLGLSRVQAELGGLGASKISSLSAEYKIRFLAELRTALEKIAA